MFSHGQNYVRSKETVLSNERNRVHIRFVGVIDHRRNAIFDGTPSVVVCAARVCDVRGYPLRNAVEQEAGV